MIKLKFLGTKGFIEEENSKHQYNSSLLIEFNKQKILIDYGLKQKNSLNKIKPDAILITHAHPDHYIWLKENLKTKIPVYLTREALDYGKFKPFNYKVISKNKKFKIGSFVFLPYEVVHSIRCPAIGYKIFVNKKIIVYNPDLVNIVKKFEILKDVDYYIGDGSSVQANLVRSKDNKIFGHARISTQINWCKEFFIKNIIFTHFGREFLRKEEAFSKKNPSIIFSYDGMKLNVR